jgi:hypothetical protein
MVVNGFGSMMTIIVMMLFAIFKFKEGAWVVVLLIPTLVFVFFNIHRHYKELAEQLSLENHINRMPIRRNRVILPLGGVHQGTLAGLHYARSLSTDVTAVHIALDPKEAEKIKVKWQKWGEDTRLVIIHSPYRETLDPLLNYIHEIEDSLGNGEMITIIVPQFIPKQPMVNVLHMRTAEMLRNALLHQKNIVITEVPYQVD